jgi:hypothetical protein
VRRDEAEIANQRRCEEESKRSTRDGEQRRFDQELPSDVTELCAERSTHGELAHPTRGTEEQEVADVEARNQEEQGNGRSQDAEGQAGRRRRRLR